MHRATKLKAIAIGLAFGTAAGGVAVATAASSSSTRTASPSRTLRPGPAGGPPPWPAGPPAGLRHEMPVHEDAIVLNDAGTAYIPQTEDNGIVSSVSGTTLAIKEGNGSVTYKTATLTIPSNATVYRNGAKASLSDLKSGDHVHVTQSSDGTVVLAGNEGPDRFHGRLAGRGGFWGPGRP